MGERIKVTANKPLSTKENSASNKQKTGFRSQSSHVDQILYLQRTIGNQAVQRMVRSGALQAKLRIGQPGDVYEQEADRVADEVMRMPEPGVQRQVEEEEEILQTKPFVDQITPLVQRQVEEEEEEEMLQAKSREDATSEVPNDLESQINAIKGGGRPLAESERAYFEPRFGYDFGQVRMHTDTRAAESARAVNALAFTVGQDVVFGAGQYVPGMSEGRRLMAHELTHVVQQGESILKRKTQGRVGNGNISYQLNAIGGRSSIPCIQMYGENVHRDATKRWSEGFFGRGSTEADTIAREDQGLDEGWTHPSITSTVAFPEVTGAIGSVIGGVIGGAFGGVIGGEIASRFSLSISDNDLVHFPSRATAESEVGAAIASRDLGDFGRALHRFQDSFSHRFPPGEGYNRASNARHNSTFERGLAETLRSIGGQRRYPNTHYGRGAVIRHVILGHYPDDFLTNPEQRIRDNDMTMRSITFIRDFHSSFTAVR